MTQLPPPLNILALIYQRLQDPQAMVKFVIDNEVPLEHCQLEVFTRGVVGTFWVEATDWDAPEQLVDYAVAYMDSEIRQQG